jgi:hypothetical protein
LSPETTPNIDPNSHLWLLINACSYIDSKLSSMSIKELKPSCYSVDEVIFNSVEANIGLDDAK